VNSAFFRFAIGTVSGEGVGWFDDVARFWTCQQVARRASPFMPYKARWCRAHTGDALTALPARDRSSRSGHDVRLPRQRAFRPPKVDASRIRCICFASQGTTR
jgi:hypothetical protein